MAGLKIIDQPAAEPVTLEEIKAQLRYETDDDSANDLINPLIAPARQWCEDYQNRAYITQTLELAHDCWPACPEIELPRPPLQTVMSIKYINDSVESTWSASNYIVDDYAYVARIVRARGASWPSASLPAANGIRIRYVAGYGDDGEAVPTTIKQAIILLVCHWFNNGMCPPPDAVYSLLNMDRVVPL